MKIDIVNLQNFAIDERFIKENLTAFLRENKIESTTIEVIFVNVAEMKRVGKLYLKEIAGPAHNVLSFPNSENLADFVFPPGETTRLGEIIVCYPVAKAEAASEGVEVGEKIYELVEHGATHLLGKHHD